MAKNSDRKTEGISLKTPEKEEKSRREGKIKRKTSAAEKPASPASWRGSYTVEAAIVVSLVIIVLAALIYAAFYAHDRAVCQSLVCEAAVTGSNFATEKERSSAISSVKKRITQSRFLGSRSLSGSASAGEKSVTSSWNAVFPVPGFIMKYLTDGNLTVKATWNSKIQDPVGMIRLIRGAGELITGGKN